MIFRAKRGLYWSVIQTSSCVFLLKPRSRIMHGLIQFKVRTNMTHNMCAVKVENGSNRTTGTGSVIPKTSGRRPFCEICRGRIGSKFAQYWFLRFFGQVRIWDQLDHRNRKRKSSDNEVQWYSRDRFRDLDQRNHFLCSKTTAPHIRRSLQFTIPPICNPTGTVVRIS